MSDFKKKIIKKRGGYLPDIGFGSRVISKAFLVGTAMIALKVLDTACESDEEINV